MKHVRYALLTTTMLSVVAFTNLATATEVIERPYVRFDAGYSFAHFGKTTNLETHDQGGAPVANSLKVRSSGSASFSIGAGYRFTDNVRGDITLQYSPHYKASSEYATAKYVDYNGALTYPAGTYTNTAGTQVNVAGGVTGPVSVSVKKLPAFKIRSLVTMAHLYYDFAGNPDFVPYIGIGLGVANLKVADIKVRYGGDVETVATRVGGGTENIRVLRTQEEKIKGGSRNNFAYGATAGVGIPVNEFTTLDVSYRYVNLGKAKLFKGTDISTKELHNHEAMIGLRYEF